MKRTALLLAAVVAVALGAAAHAATPAVALTASAAGDSVRVVATWRLGCDALGCGDSARVAWEVRGAARRTHVTAAAADTLWIPLPAWRDSAVVVVRVATMRRGLASAMETDTVIVHRLDAPPPPPDSLRVDTLALRLAIEDAAFRDSFPVGLIRDTLGRRGSEVAIGDTVPLCVFSRNRYTGRVWTMVPENLTETERDRRETLCERARQLVESERDT